MVAVRDRRARAISVKQGGAQPAATKGLENRQIMRNGQNKRMRGRNNHRKSHNPMARVYESNGPDVKIRGNPSHIAEKYVQLARDAHTSGDPIAAENYYQHAEHYFRLIAAAQDQFRQSNPHAYRPETEARERDEAYEDGEEERAAAAHRRWRGAVRNPRATALSAARRPALSAAPAAPGAAAAERRGCRIARRRRPTAILHYRRPCAAAAAPSGQPGLWAERSRQSA